MRYGSTKWVAGEKTMATWCGTHVERDDVNEHGIAHVKCAACLNAYHKAKGKTK